MAKMSESNSTREPANNALSRTSESYLLDIKPYATTTGSSQSSAEFNPDERKFLIECIRQHPCIYDKEHRDYRALEIKDAAWRDISAKTNIPVPDAMTKYHTTRTNFGRYVRSMEANTGCTREEVYLKPQYEHLRWLLKFMEIRPSTRGVQYRRRFYQPSMSGEGFQSHPDQTVDMSNMMWNDNEAESFEVETEGSENFSYGEEQEGSWTQESSLTRRKPASSSQLQKEQQVEPSKPKKLKTDDFESQLLQSLKDDSFPTDMPGDASSACTWLAIKLRLKKLTPYQQNMAQARFLQVLTDIEYGPKYPVQYANQTRNTEREMSQQSTYPNYTNGQSHQNPR